MNTEFRWLSCRQGSNALFQDQSIIAWSDVTPSQLGEINVLTEQLTGRKSHITETRLQSLAQLAQVHILFALVEESIVAYAVLIEKPTLLYNEASIEDVIVSKAHRREGIGRAMMSHLLKRAEARGVTQIELTSRSTRLEAHAFYHSLGFQTVDTTAFRIRL